MKTSIRFIVLGLSLFSALLAQEEPGWIVRDPEQAPVISVVLDPGREIAVPDGGTPPTTVTGPGIQSIGNEADLTSDEIKELARGLGHDPYAVFFWVRDNIAFSHYYGVRKGAQGALLERSGNDADTAALLVALLRECPTVSTAKYVQGFTRVPFSDVAGRDMPHWLGVDASDTLIDPILTDHGTPVADVFKINSTSNTLLGYTWNRWWLEMQLVGSSTAVWLDPSFKTYNRTPPINVGSASGYSRGLLLSAAGGTTTSSSVQNLSTTGLGNELANRTNTLLSYLKNTLPNATVTELAGGLTAVPAPTVGEETVFFPLSVDATLSPPPLTAYSALPSSLFSTLRIVAGDFIDQTLKLAACQNKTLWLELKDQSTLNLDGVVLDGDPFPFPATTIDVTMTVDHPGGTVGDQTSNTQTLPREGIRAIIYGMEGSAALLQRHQDKLVELTSTLANPETNPRVRAESQAVIGYAWLQQTQAAERMLSGMTNMASFYHHRIGVMADEYKRPVIIGTLGEGGHYVDFPMQYQTASGRVAGVTTELRHVFAGTISMVSSAMEHGVLAQQQEGASAASTASLVAAGNAAAGQTYLATNANWSTVQSSLSGYSSADLATISSAVETTNGAVLLPASGSLTIGDWQGAGYMTWKPTATSGLSIGMKIAGGYFGGYAGRSAPVTMRQVTRQATTAPRWLNSTPATHRHVTGADPVDMASGHFTHDLNDLTLGEGALPRGLSFSRHYHGGRRLLNSAGLGYGWNHSLNLTVTKRSDAENALGESSAQHAAAAVVGLYAAWDVFKNRTTSGSTGARYWAISLLTAKWLADQLYENTVTVALADRVLEFHRLPDGTYLSPPGVTATLSKNASGQFVVQERHGNTWTFNVDGTLQKVVDLWGKEALFTWVSGLGTPRVTQVTDCYNRSLTLAYDPVSEQLLSVSDSTGRSVSFGYGTDKTLTTSTDVEDKISSFTYDEKRRLTALKNHAGQFIVQNTGFDSLDRIIEQISQGNAAKIWRLYYAPGQTMEENPLGQRTTHFFDARKRSIGTMNALGHRSISSFDGQDHLRKATSPLGFSTETTYDGNHYATQTKDALGRTSSMAYDTQHRLTSRTDRTSKVTTYADFTAQHQPQTITDPANVVTTLTYFATGPAAGQVQTVSVAGVLKSTFTYDAYGRLATVTKGAGAEAGTVSMGYNVRGDLTSQTDARGFTTTHTYNERRQRLTTTQPGSLPSDPDTLSSQTYDDNGDPLTSTTPRGHPTTLAHTLLGKLLTTTLPDDSVITIGYDLADRAIRTTDPTSRAITTTLDDAGRATKVTDHAGNETNSTLDDDGRPVTSTDPNNLTTTTVYNARGEVTSTLHADNFSVGRSYDFEGRPIYLTNRAGNTWTYGYDTAGRPSSLTSPGSFFTSTGYDTQGRVERRSEASNQTIRLVYDTQDRVKEQRYHPNVSPTSTPTAVVSSSFDAAGQVLTVTEGSAVLTRSYDQRGAVKTFTNAQNETFTYRYDANGNLTVLTYPDGKTLTHAYDSRDRLTRLTDWANRITQLEWDTAGRLTQVTRPNGTVRRQLYDTAGRLHIIEERKADGHLLQLVRLGLDAGGRIVKRFTVPLTLSATFPTPTDTYNTDNWINLLHDADGNLRAVPAVPTALSSNVLVQGNPGIRSISGFVDNSTWDERNRLTRVYLEPNDTPLTFTYDAENRRLTKTLNSQTTRYTHNPHGLSGLDEIAIETKPDASQRFYVWGGPAGLLYEVRSDGTQRYYHADQVGSTLALTDGTGAVVGRLDYTPYGLITKREGDTDTPFKFNGASGVVTDGETGLIQMRARYYHPWLGRFLNQDPIGFEGGMNWFAFAGGNPVSGSDPSGLEPDWGGPPDDYLIDPVVTRSYNAGMRAAMPAAVGIIAAPYTGPIAAGALISGGLNASQQMVDIHTQNQPNFSTTQLAAHATVGAAVPAVLSRTVQAVMRLLPNSVKGNLGETFSWINGGLSGRGWSPIRQRTLPIAGRYPKPDFTYPGLGTNGSPLYVEAKFGTSTLTSAQRVAANALGQNWVTETWTYGWMGSTAASTGNAIMGAGKLQFRGGGGGNGCK